MGYLFTQEELPKCEIVCYFIFNYSLENKLKVFRWKLLHFIIPTQNILLKWKMMENNLCNLCNIEEDYSHYFMTFFQRVLEENRRSFKKMWNRK
jgi:hypothetical protein